MSLLSAIFTFAVKKKLRTDNPCHGIEKPEDVVKLRRLSDVEYVQLNAALPKLNSVASDVILMLAITGFRSGEIRNLRWSELDLSRQICNLTDTKSGLSIRPLSTIAIEIINRQKHTSEYVFPYQHGKPFSNLAPHWVKLGLDKTISPHTLRHSLASLAADLGFSDHIISGLLGHSRSSITSRYIHLEAALIKAADAVANETLRLMKTNLDPHI